MELSGGIIFVDSLLIEIVQTIDTGGRLLIGIVDTMDWGDGIFIEIARTTFLGEVQQLKLSWPLITKTASKM